MTDTLCSDPDFLNWVILHDYQQKTPVCNIARDPMSVKKAFMTIQGMIAQLGFWTVLYA